MRVDNIYPGISKNRSYSICLGILSGCFTPNYSQTASTYYSPHNLLSTILQGRATQVGTPIYATRGNRKLGGSIHSKQRLKNKTLKLILQVFHIQKSGKIGHTLLYTNELAQSLFSFAVQQPYTISCAYSSAYTIGTAARQPPCRPSMTAPEKLWQTVRCLRGFARGAVLADEEHAVVLQCHGVSFSKNWRSSCPEAGPVDKKEMTCRRRHQRETQEPMVVQRSYTRANGCRFGVTYLCIDYE